MPIWTGGQGGLKKKLLEKVKKLRGQIWIIYGYWHLTVRKDRNKVDWSHQSVREAWLGEVRGADSREGQWAAKPDGLCFEVGQFGASKSKFRSSAPPPFHTYTCGSGLRSMLVQAHQCAACCAPRWLLLPALHSCTVIFSLSANWAFPSANSS